MTTKQKKQIIRKVWKVTKTGALLVTIPRDSYISEGDYVKIDKVDL